MKDDQDKLCFLKSNGGYGPNFWQSKQFVWLAPPRERACPKNIF